MRFASAQKKPATELFDPVFKQSTASPQGRFKIVIKLAKASQTPRVLQIDKRFQALESLKPFDRNPTLLGLAVKVVGQGVEEPLNVPDWLTVLQKATQRFVLFEKSWSLISSPEIKQNFSFNCKAEACVLLF